MIERPVFNNLTLGLRISRVYKKFYLYDRRYPGEFWQFDSLDECDREYAERVALYQADFKNGG